MIKSYKFFFSILSIILFFFIIHYFSSIQNTKIKTEEIKKEVKGKIIDKYSVRKTLPTHLKVMTHNGIINISPNQFVVEFANIGDSIYKIKNENTVIIYKQNGKRKKFYYTKFTPLLQP